MSATSDHISTIRLRLLTAGELRGRLTSIGMSEREFCRLTGVVPRTLLGWLERGGAPAWVRSFIIMAEFEGAADEAHRVASENILDEEAFRRHRDSFAS